MKRIYKKCCSVLKRVLKKAKRIFFADEQKKTDTSHIENVVSIEIEGDKELEEAKKIFGNFDRDHVWTFVAGHASQDFRGNPKYLFVYINNYRSDIAAYWLCSDEETIAQVRALGFLAYQLETPAAQYAINHTGVMVTEQVKHEIPEGLENVKYLNLWHGVGVKRVERRLFIGDIAMGLAKKYVKQGTFFRDNQLLAVTSPANENEQALDCGVDEDKFIRAGYLRCLYQQNFKPVVSFEHDLRKVKGLPESTKMIVYAPTFRAKLGGTFSQAITDIEALYRCCEDNNLLLIFKVHPNMEKETGFLRAWETYGNRKHFWFWDNRDDFYEIMDQMDMAIVDYSAIISDMVAMDIPHYIRYIYDYDEYMKEGYAQPDEYAERTLGRICRNFDELLDAIANYEQYDDSEDLKRIKNKLWTYSGGAGDFEKVIDQVMNFQIQKRHFQSLYSFDVFDTLISRKVLDPWGIFFYVKEKMQENGGFPTALVMKYPNVRHAAEANVREYYNKSKDLRNSECTEITFDEIFQRLAYVYGLSDEQTDLLKKWELEAEIENVIPLKPQIDLVKKYLADGECVVLISDMYLPKEIIIEFLRKADPVLTEVPLFLSNEYGVLKTSQKLFFEVYKSFEPFYNFERWVHYGDNQNADIIPPRKFCIYPRKIEKPQFNEIQRELVDYIGTYDAYLVVAMQARMCQESVYERDEFVISYISLCLVPYVDWAIRDAMRRGYKTLYFISRDGHHLKRIADVLIKERGLSLKTKYIYASRRAWRIPSFIDEVDDGFWQPYGSFMDLFSKEKLFDAMNLDEEQFRRFFPSIDPDTINFFDKDELNDLIEIFKSSEEYKAFLLEKAAEMRELVSGYLRQEIMQGEKFAIVEYWGRGYTQESMIRLWHDIIGKKEDVPFYYSRSVLPTTGNAVRYNFTTNYGRQFFMEGVFANIPYKSVESYEMKDGKIVPVIRPIPYDENLYESMQNLLPEFAKRYAALPLRHPEDTDHLLYEFVLDYYESHRDNENFAGNIGKLVDSVALYGTKREYAPPYTMTTLDDIREKKVGRGSAALTTSIAMSYARSSWEVQEKYKEMFQILPGDDVAGGRLLSDKEMEENRKFRKKYEDISKNAKQFAQLYEEAAENCKVENKVVFVVNKRTLDDTGLEYVKAALDKQDRLEVNIIFLPNTGSDYGAVAKEIANARYIIVYKAIELFCMTKFRSETEEIMLRDCAFTLYNSGLLTNYFLKWKKKYYLLVGVNDVSVIQIPAPNREMIFRRQYCTSSKVVCSIRGNCSTDIYFDEEYISRAKRKLEECFPEKGDRKVILYMPTWRTREACSEWLTLLEMDVLEKLISDRYVVAVNFNKDQKKGETKNIIEIEGFSKEITTQLKRRELIAACDIIVGDYRDMFFEACIMKKPAYSTAFDFEKIIQSNNMSVNANFFESYLFCPVVKNSEELAAHLKEIDHYDYEPMERFRQEMFIDCDGKSVERVVNYVMDGIESTEA